jgi:hypothetical protein
VTSPPIEGSGVVWQGCRLGRGWRAGGAKVAEEERGGRGGCEQEWQRRAIRHEVEGALTGHAFPLSRNRSRVRVVLSIY